MATLEQAIEIAARAHSGQVDKAGEPYILHPLRVMLHVSDLHERMAAVLHDIVEDTSMSLEDLRGQGFPQEVIQAVDALTKQHGETRKQAAKRAAVDPVARVVKIADVTDNMDVRRLKEPTDSDLERVQEYREVLSYLLSCGPTQSESPVESRRLVDLDMEGPTHMRVDVEISHSGDLVFSGQDVGEAPQRFWGDEDYEYWLLVHAIDKDRVLLALIEKIYSGNAALVSEVMSLLDSEGIPREFDSYV